MTKRATLILLGCLLLGACGSAPDDPGEFEEADPISFTSFVMTADPAGTDDSDHFEYRGGKLWSRDNETVQLRMMGCDFEVGDRYLDAETRPTSASGVYGVMAQMRRATSSGEIPSGVLFIGSLRNPRWIRSPPKNVEGFHCSDGYYYFLDIRGFPSKEKKPTLWLSVYLIPKSSNDIDDISRFAMVMEGPSFDISAAEHARGLARDIAFGIAGAVPPGR